jgi:Tol biopolymer transport system component
MKNIFLLLLIFLMLSCQEQDSFITPSTEQGILYYCSKPIPSGAWQVYKKNLATNSIDIITNNTLYNYWWVELSPDKTQLLLLRSPITSPRDQFDYVNCEMIKCNADGSNQQIIIADNQYGWFAFGNPHWHPSGNRILMIAQSTNTTAPFYTYTVDTEGNNPKALTSQYSVDANWAPSGNKITFVGIKSTGFIDLTSFEIFTANYDYRTNTLSSVQQLTNDVTRNHDPCFSPDGTYIAFSASDAALTNADLVTIEATGNNRKSILDDGGIHGGPLNWGSNGKIYNHSIYLGTTNFTINAFNSMTNSNEPILTSASFDYISPYYSK